MKRIFKSVLALSCIAFLLTGAAACNQTAYDIAVKNGFQGTEKEWLRSLHGADGEDGAGLTATDLYETAKENGYTGTYIEFCQNVLKVDIREDNDVDTIASNVTSVVSIYCSFSKTIYGGIWGNSAQTQAYSSAGSGVIIDLNKEAGNALIVTNYHVIYDASYKSYGDSDGISENIYLYGYGALNRFMPGQDPQDDGMKATYVGGAMDYDIAILRVEGSEYLQNSILTEAEIGSSDEIQVGEKVFAIGNPDGAGIAVTEGIISVESEYISMTSTDGANRLVDYRVMRTDAAINSGNSGGALFNAKGELVGITNAKNASSEVDNMGYALPSTQVKNLCDNILANGDKKVHVATLGITVANTASEAYYDENGNLKIRETFAVAEIVNPSGSARGKLSVGDVFKEMQVGNGEWHSLKRRYQINDLLLTVRKGDVVRFKVVNTNGSEETVEITFDRDSYFTIYQ